MKRLIITLLLITLSPVAFASYAEYKAQVIADHQKEAQELLTWLQQYEQAAQGKKARLIQIEGIIKFLNEKGYDEKENTEEVAE